MEKCITIQQNFYDMLGDRDWDEYTEENYLYLKRRISLALFGLPETTTNIENDEEIRYNPEQEASIHDLFQKILDNGIQQNTGNIYLSILFIACYDKENVFTTSVFKLKKCNKSNHPCCIFIDDQGRVYTNWENYLLNNKLPECKMVVPENGRYIGDIQGNFDEFDENVELRVRVTVHDSPASSLGEKIKSSADTTSTVAGLGATVVFGAALTPFIPVAPIVLGGAAIAGGIAGAWSLFRGTESLVDRNNHQQSIHVLNSTARNCYINIVGGLTGVVAAGASRIMMVAVQSGAEIGMVGRVVYNTISVTTLAVNGIGVANSGYHIYDQIANNRTPSALDILQFSTSIFFFSHSVMTFRTASTIINETQQSTLRQYEDTLRSIRHKKMFRKAKLEATRTMGAEQGNREIILGMQKIENKDNFFAGLARTNKQFNKSNARFTISGDGNIKINNDFVINPAEFTTMTKSQRQQILSTITSQPAPTITRATLQESGQNIFSSLTRLFGSQTAGAALLFNRDTAEEIAYFFNGIAGYLQDLLIQIVHEFFRRINEHIHELQRVWPFVNKLIILAQYLLYYARERVANLESQYQEENRYQRTRPNFNQQIFDNDRNIFGDRYLHFLQEVLTDYQTWIEEMIIKFIDYLRRKLSEIFVENPSTANNTQRNFRVNTCTVCNGIYYTQ